MLNSKATVVKFEQILQNSSIGPFRKGVVFPEIANQVGPPGYWGFHSDTLFNCYLGYGPLEVSIETRDNVCLIRSLNLKVFKFDHSATIFDNRQNGNAMRVAINKNWRHPEKLKMHLLALGLEFSVEAGDSAATDISSIIYIGDMAISYIEFDGREEMFSMLF